MNRWKGPGYKAGQTIACKVLAAEPGGYAVIIPKDNLRGFLPTEARLKIGEEILAQYVCVHNNRILLSSRLAGMQGGSSNQRPASPQTDWQQQAQNDRPGSQTYTGLQAPGAAAGQSAAYPAQGGPAGGFAGGQSAAYPAQGGQSAAYPAQGGQSAPAQGEPSGGFAGGQSAAYPAQGGHSAAYPAQGQSAAYPAQGQQYPQAQPGATEADQAFQVYAQDKPGNIRLRRAIDLILPPLNKSQQPNKMRIGQEDALADNRSRRRHAHRMCKSLLRAT
jgi:hypothetical protein